MPRFFIRADGYVWSDIFIHAGGFFIGEEAATGLISYIKEHNIKKIIYLKVYLYQ